MTRHRWAPVDAATAVRHHGRCIRCGLIRQRTPGSHTTHYSRKDGEGRSLPVDPPYPGWTPPCSGEVAK